MHDGKLFRLIDRARKAAGGKAQGAANFRQTPRHAFGYESRAAGLTVLGLGAGRCPLHLQFGPDDGTENTGKDDQEDQHQTGQARAAGGRPVHGQPSGLMPYVGIARFPGSNHRSQNRVAAP